MRFFKRRNLAWLLLLSGPAHAVDESPFLDELPVVLSASRLAQSRMDAPGAVTVLDRDQIRASGLRDVADLLRLAPGFLTTVADGSYPVSAYHGLARDRSNRMQVLIDGRSVYSPYLLGGIEWNQLGISIDDIERIEIFRGTNTAAYGANAFLGVVSITTRSALDSPRLSAMTQTGDDGIRDVSAAGTLKLGRLGLRLRGGEQHDTGFAGFNDGRRLRQADLRGDLQLSATTSLEAHVGANRAVVKRGYTNDIGDPPRDQDVSLDHGLVRLRRVLDGGNEFTMSYYHQEERALDRYNIPAPIPPVLQGLFGWPAVIQIDADFTYTATRDDLEIQHMLGLGRDARLVWGAGFRQDTLEAPLSFYQRGPIDMTHRRIFGNLEWRLHPLWLANLGLMVENTSLSGTKAAPRLALNYHPGSDQAVRFAWSRGYRSPSPFEEMSDMRFVYDGQLLRWRYRPAGNLEPERITAVEMGYLHEWRKQGLSFDARLYNERVDRLIVESTNFLPPGIQLDASAPQIYSFVNSARAHMYGLEHQMMWRPTRHTWVSLSQNLMNIDSPDEKLRTSAPHLTTVLSAAHRFGNGFNISATHYHYGSMTWAQNKIDTIPTYRRTDMRIGYEFRTGSSRAELFLVAQNIGQDNSENKPRYVLERRVFGGMRVEF